MERKVVVVVGLDDTMEKGEGEDVYNITSTYKPAYMSS